MVVLGASGFAASEIITYLSRKGCRVIGTVRVDRYKGY